MEDIVPFTPERPKVGRPAALGALEEFVSAEVGLKAPDVPKAMAFIAAELVEHPDEMRELARAGWTPRGVDGFAALSFMGRGRLEAWVGSARAGDAKGGGRGGPDRQAAARAAAPPPAAPRFSPPRSPVVARPRTRAPASPAALADAGDDEARVPLT